MLNSALTTRSLCLSYGRQSVLENVSFELSPGTFTALVGENGAGKSSLIRLLAGLVRPKSGIASVWGKDPASDPHEDRRSIFYLAESLLPPVGWLVSEYFRFHAAFYPSYSFPHEAALLDDFRINPSVRIGSLSAGQMRRVQIVCALATRPKLLLIDEITAVLDILGRQRFFERLSEMRRELGTTILLGTNLLDNLDQHVTDALILRDGKLLHHLTGSALNGNGTLADRIATHLRNAEKTHGNVLPFSKTGS